MNDRFDRPPYCFAEFAARRDAGDLEAANRLLFDWWCDEEDRTKLRAHIAGGPFKFPSRAPIQNDPAPLLTDRAPQGYRDVYMITAPNEVKRALTAPGEFSNVPYAALGGASFLLAQDPGPDPSAGGVDWHEAQRKFIAAALDTYSDEGLRALACRSIREAALLGLAESRFDLAELAEQAALRYFSVLFGYGFQDHALLAAASRDTYRALQYLAIGRHFVSEPDTLPAAQSALARLTRRTSDLIEQYTLLDRSPRRYGVESGRRWPEGVQPWSDWGLDRHLPDGPVLRRAAALRVGRDPTRPSPLNGRDRAVVLATLVAGTLGNIRSAVCLAVRASLRDPRALEAEIKSLIARCVPVPVVPRRTTVDVLMGGGTIPAGTDCIVLLDGPAACPHATGASACVDAWGSVSGAAATHECLGRAVSLPLITALVRDVLTLPGLKPARDPLTAQPLKLERLWGFGCLSYPLMYERERLRGQRNLIVSMRVKMPISENAARLRTLIAGAVPRIEDALQTFGFVHFAWFEFSDDDSRLVLRTIYDGQFEAYIQHFALRAGDLFDGLFEYLEDAPPRPVAEHPREFIETIRRFNRSPLAGYLFSARPDQDAQAARAARCLP